LHRLARRPGRAFSRDQLLTEVWGYGGDLETRTVDTHIKRLRAKLGSVGGWIQTVRGLGYRFRPEGLEAPDRGREDTGGIRLRLTLSFVLVAALSALASALFLHFSLESRMTDPIAADLLRAARLSLDALAAGPGPGDTARPDARRLAEGLGVRVTVIA